MDTEFIFVKNFIEKTGFRDNSEFYAKFLQALITQNICTDSGLLPVLCDGDVLNIENEIYESHRMSNCKGIRQFYTDYKTEISEDLDRLSIGGKIIAPETRATMLYWNKIAAALLKLERNPIVKNYIETGKMMTKLEQSRTFREMYEDYEIKFNMEEYQILRNALRKSYHHISQIIADKEQRQSVSMSSVVSPTPSSPKLPVRGSGSSAGCSSATGRLVMYTNTPVIGRISVITTKSKTTQKLKKSQLEILTDNLSKNYVPVDKKRQRKPKPSFDY